MRTAFGWAPTIALSWFWGLGFFYTAHVTVTQGWAGFLAFAVPNAIGLALFGIVLERRGPADLEATLLRLAARHALLLLSVQVLALGLTLFAFADALAVPLLGEFALPAVAAVALTAIAAGQVLRLPMLAHLHSLLLIVAVAAAGTALAILPTGTVEVGGPQLALVVPTLIGFLLGPWLDVQQWHRAATIARDGGSPGRAYAVGGALFFVLLSLDALLIAGLPVGAAVPTNFAGAPDATQALAVAATGSAAPFVLLFAAIAMATTLDSGWAAVRWMMSGVGRAGAIAALLPRGLIETPAWSFLLAVALAGAAAAADLSLLDLMAPFATLFVGAGAAIVLQLTRGGPATDGTVTLILGALSLTVFGIGFYGALPLLTTLAPFLALAAVLVPRSEPQAMPVATAEVPARIAGPVATGADAPTDLTPAHGHFDGEWFNLVVMPTYDDTNSVGNVYFANYIRWVGKARELFFLACLPKFDLKTTPFLILTRDVFHQFVSELREFETAVVRLKIGKVNRKFASLEHEIRTEAGRLIGKGNQQLMFVDSSEYRLIDIPGEVIVGFFPFASKREQEWAATGSLGSSDRTLP